jgi:thioesterase domain-containing protein
MILSRRFFIVETIGGFCFAAAPRLGGGAMAQTGPQPTPSAAGVRVDLFRGLANVFSRGMDTLASRLNRHGYNARVHSTNGWRSTVRQITDGNSRGKKDLVVLIGHSLGANAVVQAAEELNRQNIPVMLIVTFDATQPRPVPRNVSHLVNFYQNNGFGRRISPGPGFQGELANINLTADRSLSHTTIDEAPRLHAQVTQQITNLVNQRAR